MNGKKARDDPRQGHTILYEKKEKCLYANSDPLEAVRSKYTEIPIRPESLVLNTAFNHPLLSFLLLLIFPLLYTSFSSAYYIQKRLAKIKRKLLDVEKKSKAEGAL